MTSTPAAPAKSATPPVARESLGEFMTAEHRRLDNLLAQAADGRRVDIGAYELLREGLLRHIRIEEKLLLPMAARRRGGIPLVLAARLRLDHGALAALMMLPPAAHTFRAIRAVLDAHNPLEENVGGVYQQCDSLAGAELDELLARSAATPAVPVSAWVDSPKVIAAAKRILARAGYDPALLGPGTGEVK
ncbi:MAG: hemerythrin domain-containing protein [Candidatus Binataceae bacterium]